MTKRFGPTLAAAIVAIASLAAIPFVDAAADPVKQSKSGICHCPGGQYYDGVSNFTAYDSLEECLAADGREPKRGQGECPVKACDSSGTLSALEAVENLTRENAALKAEFAAALEEIERLRAAQPEAPTLSKVDAFNICFEAINPHTFSSSDPRKWCKGVGPDVVEDFVKCFNSQIGGAWSASGPVKTCKGVLGLN